MSWRQAQGHQRHPQMSQGLARVPPKIGWPCFPQDIGPANSLGTSLRLRTSQLVLRDASQARRTGAEFGQELEQRLTLQRVAPCLTEAVNPCNVASVHRCRVCSCNVLTAPMDNASARVGMLIRERRRVCMCQRTVRRSTRMRCGSGVLRLMNMSPQTPQHRLANQPRLKNMAQP